MARNGSNGAKGDQGNPGSDGTNGSNGAKGDKGDPGNPGQNGAAGTLGTVANWDSTIDYPVGQVVFCAACSTNGSSYIATLEALNLDPSTNPGSWQLIAQAGARGSDGTNGSNGAKGDPGADGTNGSNGAKGDKGDPGNPGQNGAAGTLGTVANWDSTIDYTVGQVVFCAACSTNGSSYIATLEALNLDPSTNPGSWQLIAQSGARGSDGTDGSNGAKGDQGADGTNGSNGTKGDKGDPGNPGQNGAAGTLGTVANWDSTIDYTVGQVVFCAACSTNGSSYIATLEALNLDPSTNPGSWQLIAQAGARGSDGTNGSIGAKGDQGSDGTNGSNGTKGDKGDPGNPGQNGAAGTLGTVASWDSTIDYPVGQVVFCAACSTNGSSYIATREAFNLDPSTNPGPWQLIAQAGARGSDGTNGDKGDQGNPGAPGTNGTDGTGVLNSIAVGTVSNGPTGAVTIGGTSTDPTISVTFPTSAGASASAYDTAVNYLPGALVTYNSTPYIALLSSQNVLPGTNSATWAPLMIGGTGAAPSGIPYTVSTHLLSSTSWLFNPAGSNSSGSYDQDSQAMTQTACTASYTVTTYNPSWPLTYYLIPVTPGAAQTGTPGTALGSCSVTGGGGIQSCSATGISVPANTVLSIAVSNDGSGAPFNPNLSASPTAVAYLSFSCQ